VVLEGGVFGVMKIVCPQCEAWYEVPEASSGRKVRCAECRTLWTASAADAAALEAAGRAAARRANEAAAAAAAAAVPTPAPAFATATADDTGGDTGGTDADGWPDDLSPPPRESAAVDLDEEAGNRGAVTDAPSVVPDHDPFAGADAPPRDWDAEFEAAEARRLAREEAKPKAKRQWTLPRPSWVTVVLSLMVVIGVILAWRVDVVRAMPQTGSLFAKLGLPVNLRGLAIEGVKVEMDAAENVAVVIVEGAIVNVAKVRIEVPRLRFSTRDASGAEIYTWTALPQKAALAPGEAQPFRTRLASPPAESRDIQVRFFTRRDR
jgi:predicted Zn finger-like uncharacterized protein